MRYEEMAWEFAQVFDELDTEQTNEMLAKNVPMETLEFFSEYAERYARTEDFGDDMTRRLPNLMLMGYLIRVLEDRLTPGRSS